MNCQFCCHWPWKRVRCVSISMGESMNAEPPLPTSSATLPAAVCDPGVLSFPAAMLGEVALLWLVSRTHPARNTLIRVGEICHVNCAVGTMLRWGVVIAQVAVEPTSETSPHAPLLPT